MKYFLRVDVDAYGTRCETCLVTENKISEKVPHQLCFTNKFRIAREPQIFLKNRLKIEIFKLQITKITGYNLCLADMMFSTAKLTENKAEYANTNNNLLPKLKKFFQLSLNKTGSGLSN